MSLLRINPELKKNIWLEISLQRLILMPVIILIVMLLVNTVDNNWGGVPAVTKACYLGMVLIMTIWGSKVAHDNIIAEYNERTWDWQRMSAQSPLTLMAGKLFGAPVFNWYGGTICFVLMLLSVLGSDQPELFFQWFTAGLSVYVLSIAVICFSMMYALIRLRRASGRDRIRSGILPLVMALVIISWIGPGYNFFEPEYTQNYPYIFSNYFYAVWGLVGLYRALRYELSYRNNAWMWFLFIITSSLYSAYLGIVTGWEPYNFVQLTGLSLFMHAVGLTYLLLLIEPKELVGLRLLASRLKKPDFRWLLYEAPLWLLSLPFVFLGLLMVWATTGVEHSIFENFSMRAMVTGDYWLERNIGYSEAAGLVLGTVFFVVRDLAMMMLIVFSQRRRIEGTFILYLVVMYFILPALFIKADIELPLFYPLLEAGFVAAILIPAAEAGLVLWLLKQQVEKSRVRNMV